MYSTTTSDTVNPTVAAAIAPSALVPLFTVTSANLPVSALAASIEGRSGPVAAQTTHSSDRISGIGPDAMQLTPENYASFIGALLARFPVDSLTVTTDGSQATIAATPAVYESLQGLWQTARGQSEDKVASLRPDALEQLTKSLSPLELVACLDAIFQRHAPKETKEPKETSENLHKIGAIVVDDDRRVVTVHGTPIELRPIDYKLLRFLVCHPERVFSRTQLLDKVWGGQAFIEERTVDTHVMNLRKSLGQCSHYIKTVHSVGYVLKSA